MAKAKKGKLTIEDALVPVEEQPYEIPENWCWTKLKFAIETSKEKTEKFDEADLKYVGLEHIEKDGGIIGYDSTEEIKSLKNVFHKNQILYGKLRPYLNKHDVASFDGICSTDILVFDTKSIVNNEFINFFFNQTYFIDYAVSNSNGINLPRVSEKTVLDVSFPLPPLAEQKRIVEQVECLFSKLDEAKEKVQEAIDSFENRRLMVLHKAFNGDLSEKWREDNNVLFSTWRRKALKDCSSAIGDGLHGTPLYDEAGEYYFVNGNNFEYDHIEIKPDTKRVNESQYKKYYIELSDKTVFVSINGTLGKTAFYDDEPVILGKSACYVNVTDELDKYYLRFFFNTKEFIDYANKMATGSTIKNLGLKAMRSLEIDLPSVDEQKYIVETLNALLEKECSAKEVAEIVIEQIELMKKSILAKAFRGELGTNNPEEESAVKLLKSILENAKQ